MGLPHLLMLIYTFNRLANSLASPGFGVNGHKSYWRLSEAII